MEDRSPVKGKVHRGICITGNSAMENPVHSTWKSKGRFPTSCKQGFPQLHKTASYTHPPMHTAEDPHKKRTDF